MLKRQAVEFVRSTAIGFVALWISHNYTTPMVDKWRGRDGNNSANEDQKPAPTTQESEEPKLVYNHGTWP